MDRSGERYYARNEDRGRRRYRRVFRSIRNRAAVQCGRRQSVKSYKKRFDDGLADLLLRVKWWDFEPEKRVKFLPVLCDPDLEKVREILKREISK